MAGETNDRLRSNSEPVCVHGICHPVLNVAFPVAVERAHPAAYARRVKRLPWLAVLALVTAALAASCGDSSAAPAPSPASETTAAATPTPGPNVLTLRGADGRAAQVTVEFAVTPEERQKGLMFRESLAPDAGMLFVFPRDNSGGFWMKDTLVPLTIAYIDASGRVQELRDGVPQDTTTLRPAAAYRYVLEVNKGWFEAHGLGVGALVELPSATPTSVR